jgi:cytochrome c
VWRAALTAASVVCVVASAVELPQPRPIALDVGVYSAEQAVRGQAHYNAFCAPSHASDLGGTLAADTGAPPLRGAPFVASIERKGVAAVFDYVKTTMPADDPASLKDSEYLEILAFLIHANGFPPGPRELTAADLPRLRVRRPAP